MLVCFAKCVPEANYVDLTEVEGQVVIVDGSLVAKDLYTKSSAIVSLGQLAVPFLCVIAPGWL